MLEIQMDVVDVLARDSKNQMIEMCEKEIDTTLEEMFPGHYDREKYTKLAKEGLECLRNWNSSFDLDLVGPSLYLSWELAIASYFQETKIQNMDVRRALGGNTIIEHFVYKQIHQWYFE